MLGRQTITGRDNTTAGCPSNEGRKDAMVLLPSGVSVFKIDPLGSCCNLDIFSVNARSRGIVAIEFIRIESTLIKARNI